MGLPLPLATCLSWVGPPTNLGAPAQGDDRIRVPNNHRWLIQPSHSRARALGQPRSGYGVPRVAHQRADAGEKKEKPAKS